jgi:hypothetical protein
MLPSFHKFQELDVFEKPTRILTDDERSFILQIYSRLTMKTISIDDDLCIELCAHEDDVICIRSNNTDTYRIVVGRYPLV